MTNLFPLIDAERAGTAWARSLKVGDVFLGAMPEARTRYQSEQEVRCFISGALDVFATMRVSTDMQGVLIEYRQEAK